MKLLRVVLLAVLASAACCKSSTTPPATNPASPATCLDLCRHGQTLGCTWAEPTPAGTSCVDVCANNQAARITVWDLSCRTASSSCDAPGCN